MTEVEEYFPRGGKKPVATKYFKQNVNFLGKAEKTGKKKRKPKKAPEGDDGYLSDDVDKEFRESVKKCAVAISFQTIKAGLLILGRVQRASETKLYVSLPSKMPGCVMACHISEAYNKLLEAYVNDKIDKIRELPKMFRPGQYVACQVLQADKEIIMLSAMPQHVNGNKTHSDLIKGTIIQAAVSSVEDHGYVMDIGIPDTRAFLPKNNASPDFELDVGMVTWCAINSTAADGAIVTLSSDVNSLHKAILKRGKPNGLLPASPVLFTIDQPLENGIEGHILDNVKSYVKRSHTDTVKGKKPTLGQKVRAYVLYVMPTRNTPVLTMKDIFDPSAYNLNDEQKFSDGHIIEDAQVMAVCSKSVIFRLGPGSTGVMTARVQVHEDKSSEQVLAKSYPVGSTHKVRIIRYNLADHVYAVTDNPRVIDEKYFRLEDLNVGDTVSGLVKNVSDHLVKVDVGRLSGVIPHAHMSDAGYCVDPRKSSVSKLPKKKFKVGKEVRLRVLSIDAEKNHLILTAKTSLLNPELEVLKEYQQACIGKAYTGIIKFIRGDYLLVGFFNNVTAYVPKTYVTKDQSVDIQTAFHLGQIVNCTILKVDVENKKMAGSLTTAPFWPNKKRGGKRKESESESQEVPKKKRKTEDIEQDDAKPNKNKKDKKQKEVDIDDSGPELEKKQKNKKDKKKAQESVKEEQQKSQETSKSSKQKKNKKVEKTNSDSENKKVSEESDAIDTDMYDDSDNILNPQEMGLIDLKDCENEFHFKKRKFSIAKAIAAKERRIKKLDNKIARIEEKGLTPKNKQFHTAMHSEKLIVEKRIEKLKEALVLAEDKLEEIKIKEMQEKKEAKQKARKVSESKSDSAEGVIVEKKETKKRKKELEKEKRKERKKEKEAEKKKEITAENEKVKEKNSVTLNTDVIKVVDSLEPVLDVPSVKDFWSATDISANKKVQEDHSSSSEEEEKDQPKKKRKKLSVAEKLAKARAEEDHVRELERKAIESESQPRSCEQFQRALLANPDNSELWIAYMAFHLQATEIEKARAVGRKALSTISFREEHEKLNVWLALLNVEIRFGTKETQQKTLEDALQTNEPYSIHSKLLDIYLEIGSQQELSSLVDLMMRKYKRNPEAYVACGNACFKAGLSDKGRQVMQKAIAVLDKKEHVSVLVQFALLERSHGSGDRAEAIFEQITAVYPRRVDVSSAYVDMLLKSKDVDRVRQVMERMTSQKLPARKMKVLYKKWIEVEEKFGDKQNVENIRQRALEYIEKAKF